VAGEDLGALGSAGLAAFRARRVGFVFQTFHLLPYLSVLDNVALASPEGMTPAARQRSREILQRFGLDGRLHHCPGELSTGECQRVAVARAVLNAPPLILADEPTGNLDPENAAGVLEMLADYHRDGGTVLLVTHQDRAVPYGERTIRLRNGCLEP
jgi:putative ABC transport system ATP-binding protein